VAFKTLEEYQQRVKAIHKQILPFVQRSYLDDSELIVNFLPGVGAETWRSLLTDEICLVDVYGEADRGYMGEEHVFFAGGGRAGNWPTGKAIKIREWFKKNAPEVKIWV
jgi:hypothetical protein